MLDKEELDNYINENYNDILLYITKMLNKNSRYNEDPYHFFTELYLYLEERIEEIEDTDELKKWISNTIYMNTYWTNSKMLQRYHKNRKDVNMVEEEYFNYFTYDNEEDEHIKTLLKYEEWQLIKDLFYESLDDIVERTTFEIIFEEKKYTGREFGEYIGRSQSTGSTLIREFKDKFKDFYDDYMKNKEI